MVRHARKQRRFPRLSDEGEGLLVDRILPNQWYPHGAFLVLIQFAFDALLGGDEQKACDMGTAGGRAQLLGPHKALIEAGAPLNSAWSMRHAWRLNFNFGELRAEHHEEAITYSLSGYRDVPPAHAFMIAGWMRAGAQLSGAPKAGLEIMERPWQGTAAFTWRVTLPKQP